jgi:hypothetical protein
MGLGWDSEGIERKGSRMGLGWDSEGIERKGSRMGLGWDSEGARMGLGGGSDGTRFFRELSPLRVLLRVESIEKYIL